MARHRLPRRNLDYESEESLSDGGAQSDSAEEKALSKKYLNGRQAQSTWVEDGNHEEDDVDRAIAADSDEALNAWGDTADAFYASEESSEDDDDYEGIEAELQEARQIQLEQLSALTLADLQETKDFVTTGILKDEGGTEVKDEAFALDIFLAQLKGMAERSKLGATGTKEHLPVIRAFAEGFRPLVETAQAESLRCLRLRGTLDNAQAFRISPAGLSYLSLQLQITLWYGSIIGALGASNTILPGLLQACEEVAKAANKLRKIRQTIGDSQFQALHEHLEYLESEAAEAASGSDEQELSNKSQQVSQCDSDIDNEPQSDSDVEGNPRIPQSRIALAKSKVEEKEAARQLTRKLAAERIRKLMKGRNAAKPRTSDPAEHILPSESDAESVGGAPEVPNPLKKLEKDSRKAERRERKRQDALQRLPGGPREVSGDTREISRAIETNRGLTRKRKKYEGNARVHNRMKYAKKLQRMAGTTMKAKPQDGSGAYAGETAGINAAVMRSRKL